MTTAMSNYEQIETGRAPIKAWIRGVHADQNALQQLRNVALLRGDDRSLLPWAVRLPSFAAVHLTRQGADEPAIIPVATMNPTVMPFVCALVPAPEVAPTRTTIGQENRVRRSRRNRVDPDPAGSPEPAGTAEKDSGLDPGRRIFAAARVRSLCRPSC